MPVDPPAPDGSSPQRRSFEAEPAMCIDPGQALHGDHGDHQGADDHRARSRRRSPHGEQLRVPGPLPLLRRHRLPPRHPRLRAPGRRPHRHRHRGPGLQVRRRAPRRRAATSWGRWPWPTPGPTPTAASSSSSRAPTGCACRPATRCSARWCPASTRWPPSTPSGRARASPPRHHHRVGHHRRGRLTAPMGPSPTDRGVSGAGRRGRRARPLTNTCTSPCPALRQRAVGVADKGGALGKAHHRQPRGGQGDGAVHLLGVLVAEVRDDGQLLHHAEPDGERPAPGVDHGVGEDHGSGRGARHHRPGPPGLEERRPYQRRLEHRPQVHGRAAAQIDEATGPHVGRVGLVLGVGAAPAP